MRNSGLLCLTLLFPVLIVACTIYPSVQNTLSACCAYMQCVKVADSKAEWEDGNNHHLRVGDAACGAAQQLHIHMHYPPVPCSVSFIACTSQQRPWMHQHQARMITYTNVPCAGRRHRQCSCVHRTCCITVHHLCDQLQLCILS